MKCFDTKILRIQCTLEARKIGLTLTHISLGFNSSRMACVQRRSTPIVIVETITRQHSTLYNLISERAKWQLSKEPFASYLFHHNRWTSKRELISFCFCALLLHFYQNQSHSTRVPFLKCRIIEIIKWDTTYRHKSLNFGHEPRSVSFCIAFCKVK